MKSNKRVLKYLSRNVFDLSYKHLTSGEIGKLYPVYHEEVIAGDRFKIGSDVVVRIEPMLAPVMQNIYMNMEFFFVPFRIMDENFIDFLSGGEDGESSDSVERNEDAVLWKDPPSNPLFTLWDYFGLPCYSLTDLTPGSYIERGLVPTDKIVTDNNITGFYRYAYNLIYNRFYRDENVASTEIDLKNNNILTRLWKKDYFTSALPFRQRGNPVSVGLDGNIDISTNYDPYLLVGNYAASFIKETDVPAGYPVNSTGRLGNLSNDLYKIAPYGIGLKDYHNDFSFINAGKMPFTNTTPAGAGQQPEKLGTSENYVWPYFQGLNFGDIEEVAGSTSYDYKIPSLDEYASTDNYPLKLSRLASGLKGVSNLGFSITNLRLANQLQIFKEIVARSGARYDEFLLGMFGYSPSNDVLQEPVYLGGFRRPLVVSEVLQTSEAGETPQGNVAGKGLGVLSNRLRTHLFVEPGVIIGNFSLSVDHLYKTHGLDKQYTRSSRFDYFNPLFAHVSEQPVLRKEFNFVNNSVFDDIVFGYQGIYDEYRSRRDVVTGAMQGFYEYWSFVDYPNSLVLNKTFLEMKVSNAPFSYTDNGIHFVAHIHNIAKALRSIPKFAIPGGRLL